MDALMDALMDVPQRTSPKSPRATLSFISDAS